jgi:hypothetical protein
MRKFIPALVVLAGIAASGFGLSGPVDAAVTFADFSSTAGLVLNGVATGNIDNGIDANPVLRLVPSAESKVGSAFTDSLMPIDSFSTQFQFRITEPRGVFDLASESGGDGITFVIQTLGPAAVGNQGGLLGYEGITPSVAVEFDTWKNDSVLYPTISDPSSNHLGLDQSGSVLSVATVDIPGRFDDGSLWSVLIDYDGTTLRTWLNGFLTLATDVDIPGTIGATTGYVGFTSGTGGAYGNHDIVSWKFSQPIPEPTSLALFALGFAGIVVLSRRTNNKRLRRPTKPRGSS